MAKKNVPAEESTDLAPVNPNEALAPAAIPEYLQEFKGNKMGMEEVEQGDVTIPRLVLCQSLTPQKDRDNPSYIKGLEEGQFFNSVSSQIYGESVTIIPLFFGKQRIYFEDINKGGGILCQSFNGKTGGRLHPESCETCPHAAWKTEENDDSNAPDCGLFHNFVSLVYPSMEPIVVSMKSTSLKVSRNWLAMMRMTGLPMFAKVYEISSARQAKGQQKWEQFVVKPKSFVSKEFFEAAKNYFDSLHEKKIQVDTTGLGAEEDPSFNTDEL